MVTVRGAELAVHPKGDHLSDVIRRTGDYFEAPILDYLATMLDGGTIVDAGAMIGNHAQYLARVVPESRVHAFEPVPANLRLLRRNVRGLGVVVHPIALSDRHGYVTLTNDDPSNLGHYAIGGGRRDVVAMAEPLDAFGFEDVSLIKIDVEGHEPAVLRGARATIERWRPRIVIEDWEQSYADLLPGYEIEAAWPDHQTYLYRSRGMVV